MQNHCETDQTCARFQRSRSHASLVQGVVSGECCDFIMADGVFGLFKKLLPRKNSDAVAFVFMVVMLWVIALFELFIVLPIYHEPFTTWYLVHAGCGLFLFINVFANLFRVIFTDTSGKNLGMPSVLKPGWKYCPFCQVNAPPRSHHCHVCDECVLKRDHHCIFAGKCVGFANYRYYLFLALYLWLGAVYANIFHHEYVTSVIGGFGFGTFITMFLPFVVWLLGYITLYELFVTLMAGLSIFSLFLFSSLLFFQTGIIFRGQTSHERKKHKRDYDHGWRRNFREVLGSKWYVAWLWPSITSPLPGDGTNFKKSDTLESMKDM